MTLLDELAGLLGDELGDAGVGVLRAVKAALDPQNLMNPGVLIPA